MNQSTAMDYLTAPGKPGATVCFGKTEAFRLLIAFVPRSHAKCCTGFTLLSGNSTSFGVKQGFTWREKVLKGQTLGAIYEDRKRFWRSIGDAFN